MKKYILLALLGAAACETSPKPVPMPVGREETRKENFGKLFGPEALMLGKPQKGWSNQATAGMRVNPFLWRATIETLSFMPLASADSAGGILVTDWYSSAVKPRERIKITVNIKDTVLRPDALSVSLYKEVRSPEGTWVAAATDTSVVRSVEDIILTKARALKIKSEGER